MLRCIGRYARSQHIIHSFTDAYTGITHVLRIENGTEAVWCAGSRPVYRVALSKAAGTLLLSTIQYRSCFARFSSQKGHDVHLCLINASSGPAAATDELRIFACSSASRSVPLLTRSIGQMTPSSIYLFSLGNADDGLLVQLERADGRTQLFGLSHGLSTLYPLRIVSSSENSSIYNNDQGFLSDLRVISVDVDGQNRAWCICFSPVWHRHFFFRVVRPTSLAGNPFSIMDSMNTYEIREIAREAKNVQHAQPAARCFVCDNVAASGSNYLVSLSLLSGNKIAFYNITLPTSISYDEPVPLAEQEIRPVSIVDGVMDFSYWHPTSGTTHRHRFASIFESKCTLALKYCVDDKMMHLYLFSGSMTLCDLPVDSLGKEGDVVRARFLQPCHDERVFLQLENGTALTLMLYPYPKSSLVRNSMDVMFSTLASSAEGCQLLCRVLVRSGGLAQALTSQLYRAKRRPHGHAFSDSSSSSSNSSSSDELSVDRISEWGEFAASLRLAASSEPRFAPALLVCLHLLYQNMQLSQIEYSKDIRSLVRDLLIPLSRIVGWAAYEESYARSGFAIPISPGEQAKQYPYTSYSPLPDTLLHAFSWNNISYRPPNIFKWIREYLQDSDVRAGPAELFPVVHSCRSVDRLRLVCRIILLLTSNEQDPYDLYYNHSNGYSRLLPHQRIVFALIEELSGANKASLDHLLQDLPFSISLAIQDCLTTCKSENITYYHIARTLMGNNLLFEHRPYLLRDYYVLIGREDLLPQVQQDGQVATKKISSSLNNDALYETLDQLYYEELIKPALVQPSVVVHVAPNYNKDQQKKQQETSASLSELYSRYHKLLSSRIFADDERVKEAFALLQTGRPQRMRKSLAALAGLSSEQSEQVEDVNSIEHQYLLYHIALQVLALPIGRGMLSLSTRVLPSRHEVYSTAVLSSHGVDKLPIPPLVFAARVLKSTNKHSVLDASKVFYHPDPNQLPEGAMQLPSWADFHNGVATGLYLAAYDGSPDPIITKEWILYNALPESSVGTSTSAKTPSHAGMLLALGLQGHLVHLYRHDVFVQLSKHHGFTSMALLLGLGASLVGTEDAYLTRALAEHIPSIASKDGELNADVQNAALVSLGLVYCRSYNRLMTEVLLNELAAPPNNYFVNGINPAANGNAADATAIQANAAVTQNPIYTMFYNGPNGTNVQATHFTLNREREAYALSAGFGIGLINLGKGGRPGYNKWLDEKLLRYFEGGVRPNSDPMIVKMMQRHPHFGAMDDDGDFAGEFNRQDQFYRFFRTNLRQSGETKNYSTTMDKIVEPIEFVNTEVTGPGALLALVLCYLKTNDARMTSHIYLPNTRYKLETVSPFMALLRAMGCGLIMWNSVVPTPGWFLSHVPSFLLQFLESLDDAEDQSTLYVENSDLEIYTEMYYHILAGCCLALGLRYAGSHSYVVFDLCASIFREINHGNINDWSGASGRSQRLIRGRSLVSKYSIDYCSVTVLLAMACVMSGSGNLQLMQLIRSMHLQYQNQYCQHKIDCQYQQPAGVYDNTFSVQVACSMAMGLLFLGGGYCTVSSSNFGIACLLMAIFPRMPIHPLDNQYHLQALRHLYVLASTDFEREYHSGSTPMSAAVVHPPPTFSFLPRSIPCGGKLLETRDFDTDDLCSVNVRVTIRHAHGNTEILHKVSPCLMPSDTGLITEIAISSGYQDSTSYYPIVIREEDNISARLSSFLVQSTGVSRSSIVVRLQRKKSSDPFDQFVETETLATVEPKPERHLPTALWADSSFLHDPSLGLQPSTQHIEYALRCFSGDNSLYYSDNMLLMVENLRLVTHFANRIYKGGSATTVASAISHLQERILNLMIRDENHCAYVLQNYYFPQSNDVESDSVAPQPVSTVIGHRCALLLQVLELPTRRALSEAVAVFPSSALGDNAVLSVMLGMMFPAVQSIRALDLLARVVSLQYGRIT